MAGIIQLLPDRTANQIAAGEVVQRPASVVKELLENAIDARATVIKLYIKNGGCTLIQVDDNGTGMNTFDARMCWERHATSKITKADDLYNLNTLGFRGEALASIASVSEVEMKTKCAQEDTGTRIIIEAGNFINQENTAATQGTSIAVKNLFYNIPARKNFLKSISVETKHTFEEFQRIALSYPGITFEYYNQGKNQSKLESGNLEKRIHDLFNLKEDELITTNEDTDIVEIKGFIGTPKISKRTRGNQYLFANGRFIKDPYLNHAIISGYSNLLEEKKHPFYILFLKVDPKKIDVNIHPTKHEVKFEDGQHVYTLLQSVIKKTLGTHYVLPTDKQLLNAIETYPSLNINDRFATVHSPNVDTSFNPFGHKKPKTPTNWEKLDAILNTPINSPKQKTFFTQPEKETENTENNFDIFQIQDTYLVAKINGKLSLINQHRAHRQVLYERYSSEQAVSSQQLLFPRTLELSKSDFALYLEMQQDINALGFDISEFGQSTIIINGLPSELSKADGSSVIIQIIDDFKTNFQDLKIVKKDALRQAAAKNAAIKTGEKLNPTEMQALTNDLLACKQKTIDQSGKPIMVKLTKQSLERFFQ